MDDYALIDLAFNTQGAAMRTQVVPEPGCTYGALTLGQMLVARRWRRRRRGR